jgi:hypothetical protein
MSMKIYHVLFFVWVLVVAMWAINQVGESHRRRLKNKKPDSAQ